MATDIRYSRTCSLCGEPETTFTSGTPEVKYWPQGQIPHDTRCQRCGMRGLVPGEAMVVRPPRPDKEWDPAADVTLRPKLGRPLKKFKP